MKTVWLVAAVAAVLGAAGPVHAKEPASELVPRTVAGYTFAAPGKVLQELDRSDPTEGLTDLLILTKGYQVGFLGGPIPDGVPANQEYVTVVLRANNEHGALKYDLDNATWTQTGDLLTARMSVASDRLEGALPGRSIVWARPGQIVMWSIVPGTEGAVSGLTAEILDAWTDAAAAMTVLAPPPTPAPPAAAWTSVPAGWTQQVEGGSILYFSPAFDQIVSVASAEGGDCAAQMEAGIQALVVGGGGTIANLRRGADTSAPAGAADCRGEADWASPNGAFRVRGELFPCPKGTGDHAFVLEVDGRAEPTWVPWVGRVSCSAAAPSAP